MATRLMTEEPAYPVDPFGCRGGLPPLSHVRPRDLAHVTDDDPEWLAGGVVVNCP
jgi:hypothetical protein